MLTYDSASNSHESCPCKQWYAYHSNDYAFSCLAQKEDGTYYLISFWNGMRDEKVQDFLVGLDAYNAIRLDGGTSTSMVYETDVVQEAE